MADHFRYCWGPLRASASHSLQRLGKDTYYASYESQKILIENIDRKECQTLHYLISGQAISSLSVWCGETSGILMVSQCPSQKHLNVKE